MCSGSLTLSFSLCLSPLRLKDKFPKTGSVKACIRNLKEKVQYISLKNVETYGVSFGCHDNLLVGGHTEPVSV